MSTSLNEALTEYIYVKAETTREKAEIAAFALEVLGIILLNVVLISLAGYAFGVLSGTLIAAAVVAPLRFVAGGYHSDSPWRCAVFTALLFPVLALLARQMTVLGPFFADVFVIAAMTWTFFCLLRCAPVDTPSAPIISTRRRLLLRKLSFFVLAAVSLLLVMMKSFFPGFAVEEMLCAGLAVFWAGFVLLPPGKWLFVVIDAISIPRR
ncbi:MAG: accessory gene regulator ArgB-like protein [Solirubrobacterales bacterium]